MAERSDATREMQEQHAGHRHGHSRTSNTGHESAEGLRVVAVATAGMLVVALIEFGVFAIGHSAGLLSDALHNLGDVLTTVALWVAFLLARRPATERYTYGLHRAEDLAGAFIVLVIALSGIAAAFTAYQRLVSGAVPTQIGWGILAALVGFAGNEALAQYKIRKGRELHSEPLVADGKHSRADGLTSLAAAVGLALTWLGWRQADPLAGLLISLAILYILVDVGRDVLARLLDAVDPATIEHIRELAGSVAGVQQVEDVRARWAGRRLYAALNIAADGAMPLSEAHAVAERVRQEVLSHVPGAAMVDVHVDPLGQPEGADAHAWTHDAGQVHAGHEHAREQVVKRKQASDSQH